jgi:CubicO group peptidase (beta-lactamase class C family)
VGNPDIQVAVMLDRRKLLIGSAALAGQCASAFAATPFELPTTSPSEAGFASDLVTRIDRFIQDGGARNVHGVVIVRRGRLVTERYYEGDDQVRDDKGRARYERVAFSPDRSHELRSVTKSIVGLLYGIALGEGKVPALDQSLLGQFPQYTDLPDMAQRRRWTIAHAMTMTLGVDWNEEISYADPRNGQTAMEAAPDRYRYALEQPIVAGAGERWIYNGGATALIGKILENGVRQPVPDYARAVLFDRLGIGPAEWRIGRDGERNFASGLGLRPRDLARIGQMLLDGGLANGHQVVPAAWLEGSFKPAVRINERRQYGYHWYLGTVAFDSSGGPRRTRWVGAMGNGGQRLLVFPELELVVVITAGNYNQRGSTPDGLVTDLVLPSLL